MSEHVLLFSGGLDSYIAYKFMTVELGIEPLLLYFPISHRYEKNEMEAISTLKACGHISKVVYDYSLYLKEWEEPNANIPMRNLLLAAAAARYGDNIWLTVQKGETNIPDRTPEFFDYCGELLTYLNKQPINLHSPFFDITKVQMVEWYRSKELDPQALLATSSCYHPGEKGLACGECSACFRRFCALELNGYKEPYKVKPWNSKLAREYWKKVQNGFYGKERDEEIIRALVRKGYSEDE
jgi:7-cyano-7-deazaguanine synthase in queuosine biosynthesis